MKNKFLPIVTLLVSASMMMACNIKPVIPTPSSNPSSEGEGGNYDGSDSDASVIFGDDITSSDDEESSDSSASSDSQPVVDSNSLDGVIAQFVDGIDVTIPALNSYNLDYDVFYYYAYDEYYIYAEGRDLGGAIEAEYLAKFDTVDTGLVSGNDDEDYTVEEYGYLFFDSEDNVFVNFFTDYGYFSFYLFRYDGEAGSLDVSDVDTNWYVDYVNMGGYDLFNAFPVNAIKENLELSNGLVIPGLTDQQYAGCFVQAHSEDYYVVPDAYNVVLEGDQMVDYADALEKAGYTVDIVEDVDYDIDWDTFEYVEITVYTAYAYDAAKEVYITIQIDSSDNTSVSFSRFDDLFVQEKTTNTDWTDAEKQLMIASFGETIPFMQFGSDYQIFDASDEDYDYLVLLDTYFEDLSEDYVELLLANGYKEDNETYLSVCYYYDNGEYYIEIFPGYEGGNYFEIYFEDSHLEPITSFDLDKETLDIVAGASYQLTANFEPATSARKVTWTSSDNNIATVEDGLVTINNAATVGQKVTVTASVIGAPSVSCVFAVAENKVTGLAYTQSSYNVIPGGEKVKTEFITLPIGAQLTEEDQVLYGCDDAAAVGINYDNNGDVYAESNAEVGATATIYLKIGSQTMCSAQVKVVSAEVTDTLDRDFFGIQKIDYSKYLSYTKTSANGATYETFAAGNNGIQLKSKDSVSGLIGHLEGRTCKSITITFDKSTYNPNGARGVDFYASNTPFDITDMYKDSVTKVGSITYDNNNLTQTFTFTGNYSYIGIRSTNGAVYLPTIEVVWH